MHETAVLFQGSPKIKRFFNHSTLDHPLRSSVSKHSDFNRQTFYNPQADRMLFKNLQMQKTDEELSKFIKDHQIKRKKLPSSLNKSLDSSVPFLQILNKRQRVNGTTKSTARAESIVLEEVRQHR